MEPIDVKCWEEGLSEYDGRTPPHSSLWEIAWETSFSSPDLILSPQLTDVKAFALLFPEHRVGPTSRHSPLFAHVLGRLTGKNLTACLSADARLSFPICISEPGGVTYADGYLADWLVEHELMPRGLWHFTLGQSHRGGFPPRYSRKIFIECPPDLIPHFFQEYLGTISIIEFEGYVLERASIPQLIKWNIHERDAALFDKVMNTVYAVFRTFADNQGLLVITRQLDFEDFKQCICLDKLEQLARSMNTEEQWPYWHMLEELDRFAYHQRLEQLPNLHQKMEAGISEIEPRDTTWAQQFRVAWSRFEQTYQTPAYVTERPLPSGTYSIQHLDLTRIMDAFNNLRELIRQRLSSIRSESPTSST